MKELVILPIYHNSAPGAHNLVYKDAHIVQRVRPDPNCLFCRGAGWEQNKSVLQHCDCVTMQYDALAQEHFVCDRPLRRPTPVEVNVLGKYMLSLDRYWAGGTALCLRDYKGVMLPHLSQWLQASPGLPPNCFFAADTSFPGNLLTALIEARVIDLCAVEAPAGHKCYKVIHPKLIAPAPTCPEIVLAKSARLFVGKYSNGSTMLYITDMANAPYCDVSVYFPAHKLPLGVFYAHPAAEKIGFLKNLAEPEPGYAELLTPAGTARAYRLPESLIDSAELGGESVGRPFKARGYSDSEGLLDYASRKIKPVPPRGIEFVVDGEKLFLSREPHGAGCEVLRVRRVSNGSLFMTLSAIPQGFTHNKKVGFYCVFSKQTGKILSTLYAMREIKEIPGETVRYAIGGQANLYELVRPLDGINTSGEIGTLRPYPRFFVYDNMVLELALHPRDTGGYDVRVLDADQDVYAELSIPRPATPYIAPRLFYADMDGANEQLIECLLRLGLIETFVFDDERINRHLANYRILVELPVPHDRPMLEIERHGLPCKVFADSYDNGHMKVFAKLDKAIYELSVSYEAGASLPPGQFYGPQNPDGIFLDLVKRGLVVKLGIFAGKVDAYCVVDAFSRFEFRGGMWRLYFQKYSGGALMLLAGPEKSTHREPVSSEPTDNSLGRTAFHPSKAAQQSGLLEALINQGRVMRWGKNLYHLTLAVPKTEADNPAPQNPVLKCPHCLREGVGYIPEATVTEDTAAQGAGRGYTKLFHVLRCAGCGGNVGEVHVVGCTCPVCNIPF